MRLARQQAALPENVGERPETEILEQSSELWGGGGEVDVGAKSAGARHLDPRVFRVDLPGMEIDAAWMSGAVHAPDSPPNDGVGEQSEVSTAGDSEPEGACASSAFVVWR